jgi:hypothetical protein
LSRSACPATVLARRTLRAASASVTGRGRAGGGIAIGLARPLGERRLYPEVVTDVHQRAEDELIDTLRQKSVADISPYLSACTAKGKRGTETKRVTVDFKARKHFVIF